MEIEIKSGEHAMKILNVVLEYCRENKISIEAPETSDVQDMKAYEYRTDGNIGMIFLEWNE